MYVCFIIVSIIILPQEGGGHRLDSLFEKTGVTEYGESVLHTYIMSLCIERIPTPYLKEAGKF